MRHSTYSVISLALMLALAGAATLELDQRHVFEGEDFTVTYRDAAPISQHSVIAKLADQIQTITVPSMSSGEFSAQLDFKAPIAGQHELTAGEVHLGIEVEPALLSLHDLTLSPDYISMEDIATLRYSIGNVGTYRVYNVEERVEAIGTDGFDYNSEKQLLFEVMAPGQSIDQVRELRAKTSVPSEARIAVTVTYEFDQETHTLRASAPIHRDSMDWIIIPLLIIAIAAVVKYMLPKSKPAEKKG